MENFTNSAVKLRLLYGQKINQFLRIFIYKMDYLKNVFSTDDCSERLYSAM